MVARKHTLQSLTLTLLAAISLAGWAMAQTSSPSSGLPVTHERLLKATQEPANWLTFGGDYRSRHYSSLHQITTENLRRLRAKWTYRIAYLAAPPQPDQTTIWTFDRLENIGGHKTTVLGHPKVIDSPVGKAVEFDGVQDALFIDNHPLAGAKTFTWEAIFRPDGGQREQRWFHLSEQDSTGADTQNRMLFEIRVVGNQWYLDSYNQSGTESGTLMNRKALHPLGVWHHVASVYDGKEFRNYVDGVQEGAAQVYLAPHGPGHTSVGVRINKVFYFKGAVHRARFTRRALSPAEFLKPPGKPDVIR